MNTFVGLLLGFVATFLSQTLLASWAYLALPAFYALGLYLLFYAKPAIWGWPFYLGLTIGAELLGSQRFGTYSLFTYGSFLLFVLFKERLRFTSLGLRFSIALGINLIALGLIASSLQFSASFWFSLVIVFIAFTLLALIRPSLSNDPPYESI